MFIAHKNNVLLGFHEIEWECRWMIKRFSHHITLAEYWAWVDSITNDGVIDYSGEYYTIVECKDEQVQERINELHEYISRKPGVRIYNIKWTDEIKDGTHFTGDDSAKDARLLAEEWILIRTERDRLIAETDWMMLSDTGTISAAWKNYRKALREIPQSQDSVKTYADIDWPDKPSS